MFRAALRIHWRRLFSRKEYMFVVTFFFMMITAAFLENCLYVTGWFTNSLNSSAVGWMMYADNQAGNCGTVIRVFAMFLFGILAALIYGDSLYMDRREKVFPFAAIRATDRVYLYSGALVAFLGAFITFFGVYAISQLLSFLVFPVESNFFGYYAQPAWEDEPIIANLFPTLFYQYPYLNNLLQTFYSSTWAGIFAVMAYVSSLFINNRLLVLGIPQIFLMLESFITALPLDYNYGVMYYLYPTSAVRKSAVFFFLAPLAMLLLLGALLILGVRKREESLYL